MKIFFINFKNIKYFKFIIYIFILLLNNGYGDDNLNDTYVVFFNILYASFKRSQATINYLENFIDFDNFLSNLHKQILSRMRNPSNNINNDLINEYENKQNEYFILIKETIESYDSYKFIYNNYFNLLDKNEKNILQKQKECIANEILKEILNLENIIFLIKDFFNNLDNLKKKNKNNILNVKNIIEKISNKISLYFYYQKMYVAFDNLLINQYEYFIKLKNLFHSYYKQFWTIIEKKRLEEIIKTYNFYMSKYKNQNNNKIKRIIFNKELSSISFSDDYLPDILYNKFL